MQINYKYTNFLTLKLFYNNYNTKVGGQRNVNKDKKGLSGR